MTGYILLEYVSWVNMWNSSICFPLVLRSEMWNGARQEDREKFADRDDGEFW